MGKRGERTDQSNDRGKAVGYEDVSGKADGVLYRLHGGPEEVSDGADEVDSPVDRLESVDERANQPSAGLDEVTPSLSCDHEREIGDGRCGALGRSGDEVPC